MHGTDPGNSRLTLGWREWLSLPELGVPWIKVKLDTGARSSALHAFDLERFRRADADWVRFVVHPLQRDTQRTIGAEGRLIDERVVRNSGGREELRPVIETGIELLGRRWPIELTLTRRDVMGFRMLLGRQALRGRAVVDPGRSYLAGRRPKRAPARPSTAAE